MQGARRGLGETPPGIHSRDAHSRSRNNTARKKRGATRRPRREEAMRQDYCCAIQAQLVRCCVGVTVGTDAE